MVQLSAGKEKDRGRWRKTKKSPALRKRQENARDKIKIKSGWERRRRINICARIKSVSPVQFLLGKM